MTAKAYEQLRHRTISRERQQANDRVTARILLEQMILPAVRKISGLSQEEIAAQLERALSQPSKFERSGDIMLGSLRALVESLGCELRLQVRRPNTTAICVNLRTASDENVAS